MKKILCGITKNFSFLLIGQITYKVFAFFTYVLIARYLGIAGFGQFSFIVSFIGLFAILTDFGLNELLIRDVAGQLDKLSQKYISNILSIKLILTVISFLFIISASLLISGAREIRIAILVFGLCLTQDSFTIFFRSVFRLFERMEFEALSLVIEAVLKFSFIFIAFRFFDRGLLTVASAFFITALITAISTALFAIFRFIKLKLEFDYVLAWDLFKKTIPFSFLAFFSVINFKIVTVMISLFKGDVYTGLFSAANRLIEPIIVIPVIASTALFPVISSLYKESQRIAIGLYKKSLRILFLTSVFIVIVINIFALKIMFFVFGPEYSNSIISLRILSFSLIPFFFKFFLERFILVLNKPRVIISSYIGSIFITIIAGFLLMKFIGYIGAIVALVLSEFFIICYNFASIKEIKNA